jgi:hypothetical protein
MGLLMHPYGYLHTGAVFTHPRAGRKSLGVGFRVGCCRQTCLFQEAEGILKTGKCPR